jgi:trans-aconitate 2-methyltransferase
MSREWNATAYHVVGGPQTAWGEKVLAGLAFRGDERIIDLGCGTGRLTGLLLSRVPAGRVVALDLSMNMLQAARAHLFDRFQGRVSFAVTELPAIPIGNWADIAFSTATFHWVLDHDELFRQIFAALRPGGRLVAQCGGNGNLSRTHTRVLDVCASRRFVSWFERWTAPWEFADPPTTRARLKAAGFSEVEADLEEAPTRFASASDYAEFVTTVVLRPFLARLPDERERAAFVGEVVHRAGADDPPYALDYRRLNMRARVP